MPTKTGTHLNPNDVENYLQAIPNSSIFLVVFERQDGALRKMLCRRGVTKKLAGGESTIKDKPYLQGVYDMQALDAEGQPGAYRSFDKSKVVYIKGGGHTSLKVKDFAEENVIYDAAGNVVEPPAK